MGWVIADVATSMVVFGMAATFVVYYVRWARIEPPGPDRVASGVIAGFSAWIAYKTLVPVATTITTSANRSWRVPLNVFGNVVVIALLVVTNLLLAAQRERRHGDDTG